MTTSPVVPTGPLPGATGAPGTSKTSGLAVASLVAGTLGLCTAGLGGIAGLILGIVALRNIRRSSGALRGRGLAIAGLIVSVCTVLVWMLAVVVVVVLLLGPESKPMEKDVARPKAAAPPAAARLSPAAPTAAAPAELTLDLGGGVMMKMVLIPAGKFMMGSPESEKWHRSDEGPRHEVTITRSFYMGVTEVTQAQYEAVMGTNPSHFKGATNPVGLVSWNDATEFCKKLSEKTRQAVRLPTEAEWEYACRAGTQTAFSFGDDPSASGDYAWDRRNSGENPETHPVGQKKPNSWGLYDMHGNVWEWCADWYGEYPKGPVTDPSGPAAGGSGSRVVRGGSWNVADPDYFRCAYRSRRDPADRVDRGGFRCARTLP